MTAKTFPEFMRAVTTTHPDTICALANDAAERREPHCEANFYQPRTMEFTFFLVCYLNRIEALHFEAKAAGVKVKTYSKSGPLPSLFSQHCLLASDGTKTRPLVYLQRPKWIKDDAQWSRICAAVTITLPNEFEVTE